MEDWRGAKIPIIADMEASNKTWADKKEVNTIIGNVIKPVFRKYN